MSNPVPCRTVPRTNGYLGPLGAGKKNCLVFKWFLGGFGSLQFWRPVRGGGGLWNLRILCRAVPCRAKYLGPSGASGGGGGGGGGGGDADSGSDRQNSPIDVDMLDDLVLRQLSERNPILDHEIKGEPLSDEEPPLQEVLRQKRVMYHARAFRARATPFDAPVSHDLTSIPSPFPPPKPRAKAKPKPSVEPNPKGSQHGTPLF